jgi:hypothetical protein
VKERVKEKKEEKIRRKKEEAKRSGKGLCYGF